MATGTVPYGHVENRMLQHRAACGAKAMNQRIQQLNLRALERGLPLNGTLELTPRCNLRCAMCYIHRPDCLPEGLTPRPLEDWLALARELKDNGTLILVVTGGESFLYPRAEELIEALIAMGFIISLNTNGTLLEGRRLDWLARVRPAKINISLYGASNETYARLCGCGDGFDRVSAAIDGLLQRGLNVYLNGTLTPENVGDIPAMAAFAKARGLVLHSTAFLFPAGRYGLHSCPSRLSPEEAARATLLLEEAQHGREAAWKHSVTQLALLRAPKGSLRGGFHGEGECGRSNCLGGRNSFAASWDGWLMPCVTNAGIRVPLAGRLFQQAWAELRQRVDALPLPKGCEACPYEAVCNVCPAGLYNETGAFDRLAEYPCAYVAASVQARAAYARDHVPKGAAYGTDQLL